ncbi:MAG: 1-deoxy-D-xylulose-5-phosphate synthase [Steroidobacteraceae bacterium]|nr:1-deoxy-D-xylulose-5-phosphate synthase [Steroidobacteraceae bacterium]
MRDCFVAALLEIARQNRRVLLMTGDLGFGVLDSFARELPLQFLNAGVAEQNMTGMAAGLALEGRTVFTYSIANFPTLRCLEQLRNDVCYHEANVKVVAIGGGFSYGALGMSHHATEDIAILRALPGISVHAPCDEVETSAITSLLVTQDGPSYLRLDKSKLAPLQDADEFRPGRLRLLRSGRHAAIMVCGGIAGEAIKAAESLAREGIECAVVSVHTLKPIDAEGVLDIARRYPAVLTLEEHVLSGGLGSIVAEILVDSGIRPRAFARMALPDQYCSVVGTQEYLRAHRGLDALTVANRMKALLSTAC